MPTKKKTCERVQQGIAGPAPDQILEAIRAEYWLPASTPLPAPSDAGKGAAQPDQLSKRNIRPQVKP